jgi:dTDP-4-amino-4,6-dideoxygalactose transaminase
MAVPFVDLAALHAPLHDRIMAALEQVVRSNHYILGPEVAAFERELAAFCQVPHAVGVSSGTDALTVALMALGVGPGDEVVTTAFSYIASASTIAQLGATPIFADIDPASFNLDPAQLEAALTPRTKAVVVVHLFGRVADMAAITPICAAAGVPIVEDAAQSIAAEAAGVRVGGLGRLGCLSFFPAKNLGALGDGGAVTTRDPELDARLRVLRKHGSTERYQHPLLGGNFRLDALQAAVLRVKLPELERWTQARQANAGRYGELFAARGLGERVLLPAVGPGRHVFNQYVVRVPGGARDRCVAALDAAGIGCAVYYPIALPHQPCFASLGHRPGDFPHAERACLEALALPVAPGLTAGGQEQVGATLARALA